MRFRVRLDVAGSVVCNCSICSAKGFVHYIVDRDAFTLERGADVLTEYRFGTRTARHLFCSICGIHPFYVPRSHPDGIDVNVRCFDGSPEHWTARLPPAPFDGRHWEQNIDRLRGDPAGGPGRGDSDMTILVAMWAAFAGCGWLGEQALNHVDIDLDQAQLERVCRAATRLDAEKGDAARKLDRLARDVAKNQLGDGALALIEAVRALPPAARRQVVEEVLRQNGIEDLDCPPLEKLLLR